MGLKTVDTHVTLECADGVRVGRVMEGLCKWMERPAPQCAIEAVEADQDDMYIDWDNATITNEIVLGHYCFGGWVPLSVRQQEQSGQGPTVYLEALTIS